MLISSERRSTRFLEMNSCNVQHLFARDYHMLRESGRVDYHILYIVEGVCHVLENGEDIAVRAGNIVLYRPGERQEYRFYGADRTVSVYAHFSGTAVEELLSSCGITARVTYIGESASMKRHLMTAVDEWQMKKPLYADQSIALFMQFLAEAGRQASYAERAVGRTQQRAMDEVLRYMHAHYAEEHDVAFYAAMCHQSVGRFAHAFKESTGTSPKHYLLSVRVGAAEELLATTTLSVAEVAEAVGVLDVNYFSRLFKKFTGRSPRARR